MSGKFKVTGFYLKMIAAILMVIDHIGVYCPDMPFLRSIGRLSFPIFAFLVSEGFYHTRNKAKYFSRLFVFSFISEIPYDLFLSKTPFNSSHQNIFFTLSFSLLSLFLYEKTREKKCEPLGIIGIMGISVISELLRFGYGAFGILFIFSFYLPYFFEKEEWWKKIKTQNKGIEKVKRFILPVLLLIIFKQGLPYSLLSFLLLVMYEGKRGKGVKYFFYIFYPIHLLIITFVFSFLSY